MILFNGKLCILKQKKFLLLSNMYNVKDICGSKSIQKTTTNKFKQKRKSKKEILRILDENQIVMISVPTSTPRSSYIMTATRL